jgi:hypothetical protein
MHQLNMGLSGGNEKSKYYLSVGLIDQEGIVIKSDYQKYTLNMKADSKINNWLTMGGMLNATYANENAPDFYTMTGATQYPSIYPIYADNGMLGGPSTIEGFEQWDGLLYRAYHGHPLQGINENALNQQFNTSGNLFAEIEILSGLKYKGSFKAFYKRYDNTYYSPVDRNSSVTYRATFSSAMSRTLNYTIENLLTYNKNWADHQWDVVIGYESNHREFYSLQGNRSDYDNDLIQYLSAGKTISDASDSASKYALLSILGRVNYNFKGKYLASATFRSDGSSRFGPDKKWGNFPSLSAGWRVSEEGFIHDSKIISNLNLTGSYSLTGNDRFSDYRWISAMSQGKAALDNTLVTTYYPSSIENPDLAWERTRVFNIGFDIGFMDNRISLETDFYNSKLEILVR